MTRTRELKTTSRSGPSPRNQAGGCGKSSGILGSANRATCKVYTEAMLRRLLLPTLAVVALGLLAGCQGGFSERASAGKENTFRYPIVTNPTTLDPGMVRDGDTIDLLQQMFEGLVAWGTDNRVVGQLAERWEVSDDGMTFTFFLRKGVKFHNGAPFTAHDVKWSWERACHPELGSPTAGQYMAEIVGSKEYVDGKADSISGVQVVDDHTLTVQIDKPRPYILGKMTYAAFFVLPKNSVGPVEIRDVKDMVGTGPFKAESFVPEQLFVMTANKDYHGGAPKVDKIERPVIKDPATRFNKYKSGEVDLVMLERQDLAAVLADPKIKDHVHYFDRAATWYVGLAPIKYEPFKDARVRQAFHMAIDREQIVNEVLGGVNTLANSIVPKGVLGYRPDAKPLPYDPKKAAELLAAAGYPGGQGMPPLELTYREDRPDVRVVAEAVATQLQKNLGVKITQRTMEWRAYLERQDSFDLQFFHMRWGADYLDPENFLSFMLATHPYGPENKMGYSNPQFDALVKEADVEQNEAKRLALYAQAEDIVLNEGPWIPIYFQRDIELIQPKVKGLRVSLFGHLPHVAVELKP